MEERQYPRWVEALGQIGFLALGLFVSLVLVNILVTDIRGSVPPATTEQPMPPCIKEISNKYPSGYAWICPTEQPPER